MAKVYKLDPIQVQGAVLQSLVPKMRGLITDMEKRAKELAPTDTGKYINSFKTDVKIEKNAIVGELINDDEEASGVETGFQSGPVKRHKGPPRNDATVIYVGTGANVQQRTSIEFLDDIPKRLGSK